MSGFFITFEGEDGVGKSTQIRLLSEYFKSQNYRYIETKEPSNSVTGNLIRTLILKGVVKPYGPYYELFLFAADRLDHVNSVITPALKRGDIVLCDRYIDSTIIYQSSDLISDDFINSINKAVTNNLCPHLTFLLDLPLEIAIKRRKNRQSGSRGRFEEDSIEMQQIRRKKFLNLAKYNSDRFRVLDASKEIDVLSKEIIRVCKQRMEKQGWLPNQS